MKLKLKLNWIRRWAGELLAWLLLLAFLPACLLLFLALLFLPGSRNLQPDSRPFDRNS